MRTGTPARGFRITGDSRISGGVNGVVRLRLDVASSVAEKWEDVLCFCGRRTGFFFQPQINADGVQFFSSLSA